VSSRQNRPGRWRCKACGSTRIRAITEAYVDGRLEPELTMRVGTGRVEIHDAPIDPASIQCENCSGNAVRFEQAVSA
jgi:hypothetical protein